ncbi:MAG: hypothetical protein LBF04_07545 [Prevotellaceae bacterium]|nr:hypothetical protein [Prevotellaceae bacterium]
MHKITGISKLQSKKQRVYALAVKYRKKHGGIVVIYLCNDYDFTEYENFTDDGKKREIEYII